MTDLNAFRGGNLPDLVDTRTKLLFVGINPSLSAVAVQAHFATRGNRFYPALYRAGIIDRLIDASTGFRDADREHLLARGVGIMSLVPSATARADELTGDQLVAGAARLVERVEQVRPAVVAMLGITAYRMAFGRRRAVVGRQAERLAEVPLWVAPNPSGLNAHATVETLAAEYRAIAVDAGVLPNR